MSKIFRKYGILLVMIGIEGFFFYDMFKVGSRNYEMFYFSFAALWFALFFFSWRDSSNAGGGLDFRKSKDIGYSMTTNSNSYAKGKGRSEKERASILSLEFMYIGMFLANVIAYIVYVNIAF